ncbi:hypothetical protein MNBD_NITROSPIRAE03-320 [hydrothermal vent metagenome]|uniref:Uncharacterized protein n=1 Tax=hydrothermal vent metagenome TaxID=652676 RepID=A0A3B1D0C8_9ZZZZ|nr:MAG: hypothetical protein IEMM0007_1481 [bacterium]
MRNRNGFTFVEILVVMLIISIGLFVLVPRLAPRILEPTSPLEKKVNSVITKALEKAGESGRAEEITFILGSGSFRMEDEEFKLPEGLTVTDALVNDKRADALAVTVKAYPAGIIDYFELTLSDNSKLVSQPLLAEVELRG